MIGRYRILIEAKHKSSLVLCGILQYFKTKKKSIFMEIIITNIFVHEIDNQKMQKNNRIQQRQRSPIHKTHKNDVQTL